MSENLVFRTKVLYEHTVQMISVSDASTLEAVGLDPAFIVRDEAPDAQSMMVQMERSFNVDPKGSYGQRVITLEKTMEVMMEKWIEYR